MQITALVAPFVPDPVHPSFCSQREFYGVDELVKALEDSLQLTIPIIEGDVGDVPSQGYLLVFDTRLLYGDFTRGSQTIVINVDRAEVPMILERAQLACAVEKHLYFMWRGDRSPGSGHGLFGRKDIIAEVGGELAEPYRTAHYGMIQSSPHRDLPALMAAYLEAYDRARSGVPEGE